MIRANCTIVKPTHLFTAKLLEPRLGTSFPPTSHEYSNIYIYIYLKGLGGLGLGLLLYVLSFRVSVRNFLCDLMVSRLLFCVAESRPPRCLIFFPVSPIRTAFRGLNGLTSESQPLGCSFDGRRAKIKSVLYDPCKCGRGGSLACSAHMRCFPLLPLRRP